MIHCCLKICSVLGLLTQLENLLCLLFWRKQFGFYALISNQDCVHAPSAISNSALLHPLSQTGSCLHKPLVQWWKHAQNKDEEEVSFYGFMVLIILLISEWIVGKIQQTKDQKNVLCKRRMVEFISPSTTPWETKAGSELGGKRNNWALCPAQPNMGQEIRAQKSPSAISRGREASEQCLQTEKKPFSSCPTSQCRLVPPL